jgi:hypothetical protein
MRDKFVADNQQSFLQIRQMTELTASRVKKKYADKMANAKPDEQLKLKEQMAREYRSIGNAKKSQTYT